MPQDELFKKLIGKWEGNSRTWFEPGKLADLIVLDKDILSIDPDHIMDIKVEQTWLGGKLVYESND